MTVLPTQQAAAVQRAARCWNKLRPRSPRGRRTGGARFSCGWDAVAEAACLAPFNRISFTSKEKTFSSLRIPEVTTIWRMVNYFLQQTDPSGW